MISLNLFGNNAFCWTHKDNHYFTGYFFDENNRFFKGIDAIEFLSKIVKEDSDIQKLNGLYTFIKNTDNSVIIITDIINYFPVFYYKENEDWILSDNWEFLKEFKGDIAPNLEAEAEFQSIGFVLDNETLDVEIFKTRAGEKLVLNNDGTCVRTPDYYFLPESFCDDSFQKLYHDLISEFYEAGKRLIKFLNSRTAVIPLSGGFDSRLIACILKQLNYKNVICFTYGIKNKEEEISRKVAQLLGYQWYFIDYSEIDINSYLDDIEFLNYMKQTGNGFAMPYLQEYFAVKRLVEKKIINENSVFLPGHIGGLAGAQILRSVKTKKQNHDLFNNLINNYFFFKRISKDRVQLKKRISQTIQNYPLKNRFSKNYNPYIEDWVLKEKFSKFIFHSSKVFDFWGYETYFLLWDRKLIDFFRNLPFKFRENKLLYDDVAVNEFFTKHHVFFQNDEMKVYPIDLKIQKFKNKIRIFSPWKFILKRMKKHDWMYYSVFTSVMEDRLEAKGYKRLKNFKSYNAIICRWYLDFVNFFNSPSSPLQK
jgi:asparagine synthase (glutamine-hydrolysing)